MDISIIGTGYVGLVSGTCFAESGNNVICVDINKNKINKLKAGEIPIYEPGLETLFNRNIRENRLKFTTDIKNAVKSSEIVFLCLPTPPGGDGQADLTAVINVAEQISSLINDYKIIVNKSTVPVGTADKVRDIIVKNTDKNLFDIVSNPEFLREGTAVEDFLKPERVIIGTFSDKAANIMSHLYEPFVRSGNPTIIMDERSAEMTKYAANSLLATKITFMNEIANICEKVDANVDNVRKGIGTDSRIGKRFLFSGIGYGGSCFPKDVQALYYTSKQYKYDFKILESVLDVNAKQKISIINKIENYFNSSNFSNKTFGIWGLSFKPETDDVREAPSLYICQELVKRGAKLLAYDPEAIETFKRATNQEVLNSTTFVSSQEEALMDIDALVICTEWHEFRQPKFNMFMTYMKIPLIFDGRNLYELENMQDTDIIYFSIGRRSINTELSLRYYNYKG